MMKINERKTLKKHGQFQGKRNLRQSKSLVDERDSGYYGYRCNKGVCRNV